MVRTDRRILMLSLGHDNRRRAVSACYGVAAAVLAFATIGARPLHAQQATATWTELSPRTPETGQPFRLDIHITTVPTSAIRVLAADWPAGIRVLGGPELRDPDSSGDAATILSYSLEARRSGSYLIEGFLVRLDDEVLYTRPTPLQVARSVGRLPKPTATWELAKTEVLVGETVPVALVVEQADTLRLPHSVEARAPRDVWFEEYPGTAGIGLTGPPESPTYRMPVATYLLTATRAGRVTLASARVVLGDVDGSSTTVFSEPLSVRVDPAPPEVAETGAIGDFEFRAWVEDAPAVAGHSIDVHLEITGVGNVKFVVPPALETDNLPPASTERVDVLETGPQGYTGSTTTTHRFAGLAAGSYRVTIPEFASYQPSVGALRYHRGVERTVIVVASAVAGGGAARAAPDSLPAPVDTIAGAQCESYAERGRSYLLLAPAPLLLAALALTKGRSSRAVALLWGAIILAVVASIAGGLLPATPEPRHFAVAALVETGNDAFLAGNYAAAAGAYRAAAERARCPAAVWFNLGLAAAASERYPEAIAWLRAAARHQIPGVEARAELARVERTAALSSQHRAHPFVRADLPFVGLAVAFALSLAMLAYFVRAGGVGSLIAVILLGLVSLGFLATTVTSVADRGREVVVAKGGSLKRVPLDAAGDWVALAPGTTLALRGSHEAYHLVRTAYGLNAWIRRDETVVVPLTGR